jgi:hypothetical protein
LKSQGGGVPTNDAELPGFHPGFCPTWSVHGSVEANWATSCTSTANGSATSKEALQQHVGAQGYRMLHRILCATLQPLGWCKRAPWQASGYLSMSMETLLRVYGHHHPDYQRQAAENIGRRPQNVRVIAWCFGCVPHSFKQEIRMNSVLT